MIQIAPFSKRQILDPCKFKEFPDDNFNLIKKEESYQNG